MIDLLRYPVVFKPLHSYFPTILGLIYEMATLREMISNFQKLDKFDGVNFRRWKKKKSTFF